MGVDWEHFEAEARHWFNAASFVPPELRNEGRFGLDDPPEFGLPVSDEQREAFPPAEELQAIEQAAILAHRRAPKLAEGWRAFADYDGLGEDPNIPDQRRLLADNDPLD